MTDRAQQTMARHFTLFIATLIIAAGLFIVLDPIFADFMDYAIADCTTTACDTGTSWVQDGWNNIFFFILIVGLLALVVAAIRLRRV